MHVRFMSIDELSAVYKRVRRDFPPIEYPPQPKMRRNMEWGAVQAQLCEDNGQDIAYAFTLRNDACSSCMLFLYAVEPELRGKGVGSEFLRALIAERRDMDGMYAEVEMAELAETIEERLTREKRIAFYEALGFRTVSNLEYHIYGVQMHLLYRPISVPDMPDADKAMQDAKILYDGILRPWERFNLRMHKLN